MKAKIKNRGFLLLLFANPSKVKVANKLNCTAVESTQSRGASWREGRNHNTQISIMDKLSKDIVLYIARWVGDGVSCANWSATGRRYRDLLRGNDELWEWVAEAEFGWKGTANNDSVGLKRYVGLRRGYAVEWVSCVSSASRNSNQKMLCEEIRVEGERVRVEKAGVGHWQEWKYTLYDQSAREICRLPQFEALLNACKTVDGEGYWISTSIGVAFLNRRSGELHWPYQRSTRGHANRCIMMPLSNEEVVVVEWHFFSDSGVSLTRVSKDATMWHVDLPCAGVEHSEYVHDVRVVVRKSALEIISEGSYATWERKVDAGTGRVLERSPHPHLLI